MKLFLTIDRVSNFCPLSEQRRRSARRICSPVQVFVAAALGSESALVVLHLSSRITAIAYLLCPLVCVPTAAAAVFGQTSSSLTQRSSLKFDFGPAHILEPGYTFVRHAQLYAPALGYGWLDTTAGLTMRDRETTDLLRRDFVVGFQPARFRIDAPPGLYRLTIIMGDEDFGNHMLQVSAEGSKETWPPLLAGIADYGTLTASVETTTDSASTDPTHITLNFSSPRKNWVINALTLEPTSTRIPATVTRLNSAAPVSTTGALVIRDQWQNVSAWPDPTAPLLEQFRKNQDSAPDFRPTSITRADYLKLVAADVDFFKQHQNQDGAIIDPYKKEEWQYSTPCFALAAATIAVHANRTDLLEPAARAMDWSCLRLSQRKAATAHEDFYPPQLAHALPLLESHVEPSRAARWKQALSSIDPYQVYRNVPGQSNWNVVATDGEYLLSQLGIRDNIRFVEDSVIGAGRTFRSRLGLYLESPMAYDHFPRMWAADMIAAGYNGRRAAELTEVLRRGAITSLFMQSPCGELPLGGRSAQHQWNEAEQVVTYEINAAQYQRAGDSALAAAFKRAAHLAFQSMLRWQRPSGELFVVKNHVDPARRHGFEGYSAHSQYNLLPMAMLSIAWQHAAQAESITERASPADVGGFVLEVPELHKVFANAGGMYLEIETAADLHYDSTGLIRVHKFGLEPLIGPSTGMTSESWANLPGVTSTTVAIGPAWLGPDGKWHRLAEFGSRSAGTATISDTNASPSRVRFDVEYKGDYAGVSHIKENYDLTPARMEITTTLERNIRPIRLEWPVFAYDGQSTSTILTSAKTVTVSLDEKSTQTFTAPNARSVSVTETLYPNRNGWSRVATAEFPEGGAMQLVIQPQLVSQPEHR